MRRMCRGFCTSVRSLCVYMYITKDVCFTLNNHISFAFQTFVRMYLYNKLNFDGIVHYVLCTHSPAKAALFQQYITINFITLNFDTVCITVCACICTLCICNRSAVWLWMRLTQRGTKRWNQYQVITLHLPYCINWKFAFYTIDRTVYAQVHNAKNLMTYISLITIICTCM